MHWRFVRVHSKRISQSAFNRHITIPHRPHIPRTELLSGHAILNPCRRAVFCSNSTKRRSAAVQPPSFGIKPDVSFNLDSRRPAKIPSSEEASSSYQLGREGRKMADRDVRHHTQVRRQAKTSPGKIKSARKSTVEAKRTSNESFTHKSIADAESCNVSWGHCDQFYSDWWISCFKNRDEYFSSLEFPLAKIEIWLLAYRKVYWEVAGNNAGILNVTPTLRNLKNLILKGKYHWEDPTQVYLSSPEMDTTENPRATLKGSPCPVFQDSVVQEALLLILEPIFEARFSSMSHASRPGRGVHTAIKSIHRSFAGCVWFIKGDCGISNNHVALLRVLDSVTKVVIDFRIVDLLRSAILPDLHSANSKAMKLQIKERKKYVEGHENGVQEGHVVSRIGVCGRLMPFLQNVFLDQLDHWMSEKIHSLSNKKDSARRSSGLLFKLAAVSLERRCRMAYVRYGTQFLAASSSTLKEVEEIRSDLRIFLNKKLGIACLDDQLAVSHISSGVTFLDHSISRKVVRPVLLRRTASNGVVIEKKVLGIALSIKASRQCYMSHLHKLAFLSSSREISDVLSILNEWYRYAENRKQTIQFCKFEFCSSYVQRYCLEQQHVIEVGKMENLYQEAMKWMDQMVGVTDLDKVYPIHDERNWVPEHEDNLRKLTGMQSSLVAGQHMKLSSVKTLFPQQHMSQVVWKFLRGFYPIRNDYCIEPETEPQAHHWADSIMSGFKSEVLVNRAG